MNIARVGKYMHLRDTQKTTRRQRIATIKRKKRREEKEIEKKEQRRERERESSADPDPVTEAGDGTTKSNPPSKIESRRGSVYLMKEKRRQRIPPSPKIKRVGRVEKRSRWTEVRRKAGRRKISKRLRGEDLSRVPKSRFPALSNLLLPRSLPHRQSTIQALTSPLAIVSSSRGPAAI